MRRSSGLMVQEIIFFKKVKSICLDGYMGSTRRSRGLSVESILFQRIK